MNFLIAVDMPERDKGLVVQVENAEDEMHARLAAYYHIYGTNVAPTRERVVELTTVENNGGHARANYYMNIFKDKDGSN